MRKTLFSLLIFAVSAVGATAATIEPIYHLAIDSVDGGGVSLVNTGTDTSISSATSGGYLNYVGNGYAGGAYSFQNNSNYINVTGLSLSSDFSFTMAVQLRDSSSPAWGNLFLIDGSAADVRLQNTSTGDSTAMGMYSSSGSNGGLLTVGEFVRLTFVYDSEAGICSLYQDDELIITLNQVLGTVSRLNVGGNGGNNRTHLYIDEVAIYDCALTAEQISADLVGKASGAITVPEPATASLSLLGLAALMMRRRRA